MSFIVALLALAAAVGVPAGLILAVICKLRRKSAKKALYLTAISIVIFLVAAYTVPDISDEPNETDSQDAVVMDSVNVDHTVSGESSSNIAHDSNASYIGADLQIYNSTDFSENRAWIEFRESQRQKGSIAAVNDAVDAALGNDLDKIIYGLGHYNPDGNNRAALVDTTGKILWESELTESDCVLIQKSDFQNGVAYLTFSGNEQNRYYIIDSDGNVTFTKEATDDFIILACGGGSFLVAEHISNFDTDEWQLWIMDKNGKMITTPRAYEKTIPVSPAAVPAPDGDAPDPNVDYWGYLEYQKQFSDYEAYANYSYTPSLITIEKELVRCKYLGENIYQLWPNGGWESVVLNMESQHTICSDFDYGETYTEVPYFMTGFENGIAHVMYEDSINGAKICKLHTDGTVTPVTPNMFSLYANMYFSEGLAFVEYQTSNDVFVDTSGVAHQTGIYCNLQGDVVIEFPQYHDGKHIYSCGPFQNGYASMKIMGADSLIYITAVNKNGEIMFEPIPGFDDVLVSPDGKYVTGITFGKSVTVFTIDGIPKVTVQGDIIQTYDQSLDQYRSDTQTYRVCNGLLHISDFYVNVEDGSVIGLPMADGDDFTVTLH